MSNYIAPFHPLPWQEVAFVSKAPVLLLTGNAGGGKSRVAGEKIHAYCLTYPGATGLITRKVEQDLESSSIPFMKETVIDIDNEPRCRYVGETKCIIYENGSKVYFRGMQGEKQRKGIRSIGGKGGLDIVWMEEAIEFEEEDINELHPRMRGKAANWRQIILTTNPDEYLNWINQKLILGGGAKVIYSYTKDNIHNPADYEAALNRTTGIERLRLVEGRWTSGAGQVIDQWDDLFDEYTGESNGGNVTLDAEYTVGGGVIVMGVDDGYAGEYHKNTNTFTAKSHPRVFLLAQITSDDVIKVFYENYAIKTLAENHLASVKADLSKYGYPKPAMAHVDRSAVSLQSRIRRDLCDSVYQCATGRDESIKELNEMCAPDKNEVRRILVHPRCIHLRQEMGSWVNGKNGPKKEHDNGPDALRYLVWNTNHVAKPVDISVTPELQQRIDELMNQVELAYILAMENADRVLSKTG